MAIRRPAAPVIPSAGKRFDPAGEAAFRREMERSLQDLGAVMAAGIDDSQLSANVALRDAANDFTNTGGQTFRGEVKIVLAGASDHIRLERTGSAVDDMDIQFASSGLFLTWSGVSSTARFNFNGPNNSLDMPSPLVLRWANTDAVQGTTFDVNLYRSSGGALATDDSFEVGHNLYFDDGGADILMNALNGRVAFAGGTSSSSGGNLIVWGPSSSQGAAVWIRSGTTQRIVVNGTGIGFHSTTPIAKPTVSGSRGGNAALASLLTALANYGLITDSTTA